MKFTKRDFVFSIITGLTSGFIAWGILDFLQVGRVGGLSFAWLVLAVPVLWVVGVNAGYFLGRWFGFFNQFGKYSAIGLTNAAIDFGILNLFIALTGSTAGLAFALFKGVSTAVAVVHSYILNKYWAFEAGASRGGRSEIIKFIGVSLVAIGVNVAVASFVVNFVQPQFGISPEIWANLGAVAGSASALIFSFIGFSKIVFRR